MSLIRWNDSFSVNVTELDLHHKKLVLMIGELADAMKEGKGKDVLGKILNSLIAYTASHFQTEEKYFKKFNYPYAEEHKKEHTLFVKNVLEFKEEFNQGRTTVSVSTLQFLSKWLQTHMRGADMKYSSFFNKNGLK